MSTSIKGSDGTPVALPGTVEWWRQRYAQGLRRRPRDDGLSIERITTAALAISDAEGLEALTMRRLATDLGAGVASLYRHVATRDELLVEMMDHVLGEICPSPPTTSWREETEWLARELRRVLLVHRGLISQLPNDRLLGPNAMRGREMCLRALLGYGFDATVAIGIYGMIVAWVLGHTMVANNVDTHRRSGDGQRDEVYAQLDADEFPTVQGLARVGDRPGDNAIFDLGLATILDGITTRFVG